jgi:hypothetical protein
LEGLGERAAMDALGERQCHVDPCGYTGLCHYIEMVLGMVVLGLPIEGALRAIGTSTADLRIDAPAIVLLGRP